MREVVIRNVMLILAVVTPLLGTLIYIMAHLAEKEIDASTAKIRRNAIILMLAGPFNLLLWFAFNGLYNFSTTGNIIGITLALIAFMIGGYVTGFWSRIKWFNRSANQDKELLRESTPQNAKQTSNRSFFQRLRNRWRRSHQMEDKR